jgi:DNA invertase Pin-like site-specific DNA recombinase
MKAAVYARVSTELQTCDLQIQALQQFAEARKWEVVIFEETASGADAHRPVLRQLVAEAKRRKFDAVLVWRLDRLARSLKKLIELVELFNSLGVEFISLQESIDTTTPGGKLVFHIFGAIAECERSLIGERVRAGMAAAKRRGKRLGRPPLPNEIVQQVLELRKAGRSYGQIARRLNLRRGVVSGIVQRASQKGQQKPALESAENKESQQKF